MIDSATLVHTSIEIHQDIDTSNDDLRGDQHDDDPLEILAYDV